MNDLRPSRRPIRNLRALCCLVPSALLLACNGDSPAAFAGEIEFRGEQPFLPGFDFDSGFIPEDSPVTVRALVTAGGGVTVVARATTDGESLTPVAGSGSLAVEGGLTLEVSAKIEVTGANFEGVIDTFEYAIEANTQMFEPFATDTSAVVASMLPAAELGSVPIPGLPGATLVLSVTGGEITTTFGGTCAEAQGGFGEYAGELTMEGTVAVGATIDIDIPFVLTESYGPFPIDVPIPAITTALDLGTRSLATGEVAEAMGICANAGTTSEAATNASMSDTADPTTASTMSATNGNDDDDSPSTTASPTTTSADTSGSNDDSDDDSSGDDSSPGSGDPDYPNPYLDPCPAEFAAVAVGEDPPNAVCLPPCATDDDCPSGATGDALPLCVASPDSSFLDCLSDDECDGQMCIDGVCQLPPTHCALICDDTMTCPDTMICVLSACTYLE